MSAVTPERRQRGLVLASLQLGRCALNWLQIWQCYIKDAVPAQHVVVPARGHMGGLVGGALTAYFLGPHLKVVEGDRARRLIDSPPVPIFASKL